MKNVFPAVLRGVGPPSQATILNEIPLCVQCFFITTITILQALTVCFKSQESFYSLPVIRKDLEEP